MPWKEVSTMDLREEFVMLASHETANHSTLCARFGISRKTGYKWLDRFAIQSRGPSSLLKFVLLFGHLLRRRRSHR